MQNFIRKVIKKTNFFKRLSFIESLFDLYTQKNSLDNSRLFFYSTI